MSMKIVLILAILVTVSVHANQLIDELSDAQIKRIFHRSRDELPNYETANLKTLKNHRSKREVRPVEFEVDGKKIQLNLTPAKFNSLGTDIPVWTVESDFRKPTGRTYNKVDQKQVEYDGILYEDLQKMATLLAYYKDRNIYYDGVFGEGFQTKVVRSVPESWRRVSGNESFDDHVVFDADENDSETVILEGSDNFSNTSKLDKPLDVLYPKLFLVIEYNYFKTFSEDISETIKNAAIFWNAVNLKYSKLTSPKVNIVITGILIAKDDTALRYIYAARNQSDMNTMNHVQLLNGGSTYFREEFNEEIGFKNYDATITMTSLRAGAVAGSAYPGRICSSSYNVGFVRDDSSFSGIVTATHELGHLLNLLHDGQGRAKNCEAYIENDNDKKLATVMAPFMASVDGYFWSKCSKKILKDFASTKASECMKYPYRL